jgi:TonB-dependent SusC/RagA subfamily outer membrane receptor
MKNMKNVNQMSRIKAFLTSKLTLSLVIMVSCISLQAQNTITGSVGDQNTSQSVFGVSVTVKGTKNATITDVDGNYKLNVADTNATLVFSYIGYVTVEEAIAGRQVINVLLKEENNTLNEVVVIGYGSVKKSGATGAISSLKAKQLDAQSNTNLGSAIQGKVAGVSVEAAGGSPGSGTRIQIRGAGSLNNNTPLILVDDIQVASMNSLSPNDIESIEVLKDAAAAAIYGSRAANGVIIITTKNGKKGDIKVTLDVFGGVASVTKQLDLLNQEQWAKVSNAAYAAAGKAPLDIALNPEVGGAGVNYQDEIFRLTEYRYNLRGHILGYLAGKSSHCIPRHADSGKIRLGRRSAGSSHSNRAFRAQITSCNIHNQRENVLFISSTQLELSRFALEKKH